MHLFTQNLKVWHLCILNPTLTVVHLCFPLPIQLLLQRVRNCPKHAWGWDVWGCLCSWAGNGNEQPMG